MSQAAGATEDDDQVQHALLTDGTAFNVDADDAEQEMPRALAFVEQQNSRAMYACTSSAESWSGERW